MARGARGECGVSRGRPSVSRLSPDPLTLALSPSDGEGECILHLFEFDFEGSGDVGGHHAEGLLWRTDVDGLPVAVEDQGDRFVEYGRHKIGN